MSRGPDLDEELLQTAGQLRIETDASIWLVAADPDCRLRKHENPRPTRLSLDDALADASWHRHVGVWHCTDGCDSWLRILPAGRSLGSFGITTGTITGGLA